VIRGGDAVEAFLVCGLYPLYASLGFGEVSDSTSVVSKVVVPLPAFPVTWDAEGSASQFLGKVEMDA
jgi:hypothetical protein